MTMLVISSILIWKLSAVSATTSTDDETTTFTSPSVLCALLFGCVGCFFVLNYVSDLNKSKVKTTLCHDNQGSSNSVASIQEDK
eukprot:Awhi_evm1s1793